MQENRGPFAQGGANTAYARYFVGNSYLNMLSTEGVVIGNVTFEPGCRNNWHIHEAASGGGQILLCTSGRRCSCKNSGGGVRAGRRSTRGRGADGPPREG